MTSLTSKLCPTPLIPTIPSGGDGWQIVWYEWINESIMQIILPEFTFIAIYDQEGK